MVITTEKIREKVERFIETTGKFNGVGSGFTEKQALMLLNPDTREHVIQISISILGTKWEVGPGGGGFVEAIVNNDLMGSFGRADRVNREFIGFYCSLLYNVGI